MKIEAKCPHQTPTMICVLGNQYELSQDVPNLKYVGRCVCCAKVAQEVGK